MALSSGVIDNELIAAIVDSVGRDKRVRRKLPEGGRIVIDRSLPFLFVYRKPPRSDDPGTERLLLGEAAYLLASGSARLHGAHARLVHTLIAQQHKLFGNFLLFELWAGSDGRDTAADVFRLAAPRHGVPPGLLEQLENMLLSVDTKSGMPVQVAIDYVDEVIPPGRKALLSGRQRQHPPCIHLGLEIPALYRDSQRGAVYPFLLRALHHELARVLKRLCYAFVHSFTHYRPRHFHELGSRAISRTVLEADRRLATISGEFDLLLHVSPVNAPDAWETFKRGRYVRAPELLYRPRPVDPALLKRRLFQTPVERIEDPTLAHIFQQKRDELERRLTLMAERNTPRFLLVSRQLFGDVDLELLQLARQLLLRIDVPRVQRGESLDAERFVQYAREELAYYRRQVPGLPYSVVLCNDVPGMVVTSERLLVGRDACVPAARLQPTLAHMLGTHVLTQFNGSRQPLKVFRTGLAGHESLQEGLAVLSEYLVDGIDLFRLRLLAARVVAVHAITEGADFMCTYRELHRDYGLPKHTAFNVALRVFRAGGFTRDMIYLSGLKQVLDYLGNGGELQTLLLGRVAYEHLPLVEELRWRRLLKPAALTPRYLEAEETQQRLARLRSGMSVIDLLSESGGAPAAG